MYDSLIYRLNICIDNRGYDWIRLKKPLILLFKGYTSSEYNSNCLKHCEGVIIIRAFIGIDFDREVKDSIFHDQQRLKEFALKGRWKQSDNFHLTLKFLGEINSQQKKQIDEALKNIGQKFNSIQLGIDAVGVFPGRESIRVLWLGLSGDLIQLNALSIEIDKTLASFGFPMEKRSFKPHITIGQDIVFKQPFEEIEPAVNFNKLREIQVNSVALFKSEQLQNKRIYTKVTEFRLG